MSGQFVEIPLKCIELGNGGMLWKIDEKHVDRITPFPYCEDKVKKGCFKSKRKV